MALIEWKDIYSVGDSTFDADHKQLIAIINRVEETEKKGGSVHWVLQDLEDYATYHFRREEELLEAIGYPEIVEHKREHKAFVEWVDSVKKTYGMDPEAPFHLTETVKEYLKNWLIKHILASDMEYKPYLSGD